MIRPHEGSEAPEAADPGAPAGPSDEGDRTSTEPAVFRVGDLEAGPGRPAIMAVVNRSTDSFYTSASSTEEAVLWAERVHAAGAAIIDIGGVRAGRGREIGIEEEIGRVCPVIEALHAELPDLIISVDTWRAEVARAAVGVGARLLNDTWAGADPALAEVAGASGTGLVCSHTGGQAPRTDAHRNVYGSTSEDIVGAVIDGIAELVEKARAAGVEDERILADPTPDFGKNTRQSLMLMRRLDVLTTGRHAVLLAISRKDFVGEATGVADPAARLPGTLAATALAVDAGVGVIRTHDVEATQQVIDMVLAVRGDAEPRRSVRGLA